MERGCFLEFAGSRGGSIPEKIQPASKRHFRDEDGHSESLFLTLAGGGLGLGVAWLIVLKGDPTNGLLPLFVLPPRDAAAGIGLMVLMGVFAGIVPAMSAMRLQINVALRKP